MASIRIPTPLRAYTSNQAEVQVAANTVAEALTALTTAHPDLMPHLFADGKLRNFVNVFLGDEDIRFLDGVDTLLTPDARLRIIPSIAGGADSPIRLIDQRGLKFGNGATIVLLVAAFVLNAPLLVLFVAFAQLAAGLNLPFGPYRASYRLAVQQGWLKTNVVADNPEPHRFAMLVGAGFNTVATLLLLAGSGAGWVPVWMVIALANLNFWLNLCVGCLMYYQLNRMGVFGFTAAPLRSR